MRSNYWTIVLPVLFLLYSLPLFLRVFATTQSVIDEEFHLRQGIHYCKGEFHVWDKKITTFPGLYLLSALLKPLDLCNVFGMRLVSLVAATINVVLLYKIRSHFLKSNDTLAALDAFTLSALPPLYFFTHLYYTDALSLSTVLLFYYFWLKEAHLPAAVYAAASVLVRQTNIVWICMIFGLAVLEEIVKTYAKKTNVSTRQVQIFDIMTLVDILFSMQVIFKSLWRVLCNGGFFLLVIILPFVGFVILNGSIVVGDKRAHEATIHLPQLFYFSFFVLCFSLSHAHQYLKQTLRFIFHRKLFMLMLLMLCLMIIKYNTLEHPYLLADNRHYVFYIWSRFFRRYVWFKYAMAPMYVFAMALVMNFLQHKNESFKLMFWIAVVLVLCFQRLLEIRYFLIPFIILRLNMQPLQKLRWLDFTLYMLLNAVTFYNFFTIKIFWREYKEPQRIIW